MRRDRIFRHDKRERPLPLLHAGLGVRHDTRDLGFVGRKRQPGDLERVEELVHDAAHLLVLRLVFHPGCPRQVTISKVGTRNG